MYQAVIKIGGHAMTDQQLLASCMQGVYFAKFVDKQVVLIHGGGPQINTLLERLAVKSEFVNGLRKTDADTLAAVEMALCGQVNKKITRLLLAEGVDAVGISGEDGDMLKARVKDDSLGFVGTIFFVNPGILTALLTAGYTPVVAPLATDSSWQPLNVNADTAAGAIAGALKADIFVLVSDVPGVLDKNGNVVPALDKSAIKAMIKDGTINGGMIPKVECCLKALASGCKKTVILNGTKLRALGELLVDNICSGTVIS